VRPSLFFGCVVLGLTVRLAGVLFGGIHDLYQMLLDWGFAVHRDGLVQAFRVNYGILSYAFFGLAAAGAEALPRFWWAPYKLIVLGFDVAVFAALLRLVPPERRHLVLFFYWLNPWFILHEAFHGFWEAPHILLGLLAVFVASAADRTRAAWAGVGALVMTSALFKPQGLAHFAVPLVLYLAVQAGRGVRAPLVWSLAGMLGVAVAASAAIAALAGSALALVENYGSAFRGQPAISNGGPGIWQFVAFVYMLVTGEIGHAAFMKMPAPLVTILTAVAGLACLVTLLVFAWRVRLDERARPRIVLIVLTLGSLVISQFGARAHVNHSYTAMVLCIPLALERADLRRLWVAMAALLGVVHLGSMKLGLATLLPPEGRLDRYGAAQPLIERILALPASHQPDGLLAFHQRVNDALAILPGSTGMSPLSPVVFVVACLMVVELFRAAGEPRSAA
jgi:hypothetical protein